MSNSPAILEQLKRRCHGRNGFCSNGRRHGLTSGQAAREAAAYPFRLCRAILVGMRNELARTNHLTHGVLGYQAPFDEDLREVAYRDASTGELWLASFTGALDRFFEDQNPATEVNAVTTREAVHKDAVTGQPLRWPLVAAARKLELEYFEAKKV